MKYTFTGIAIVILLVIVLVLMLLSGLMSRQEHVELLDALKQHKSTVILSGYPSELYDRELAGWTKITRISYNQNADQRTEVLWCNFELPGLFEMEGL